MRELRNILERAAILCDGGLITEEHLALPATSSASRPLADADGAALTARGASASEGAPSTARDAAGRDLKSVERSMIEQALQQAQFNKSRAAKALGLTRHQLYIRMRRHGLDQAIDP